MNGIRYIWHPEIEFRASALIKFSPIDSDLPNMTSIDLLEVHADRVIIKLKLDHHQLLDHFQVEDADNGTNSPQPKLRILFVEGVTAPNSVDHQALPATEPDLALNATAHWMQERFGVSPLFFSRIQSATYVGCASMSQWKSEEGERISLDGIYRFSSGRSYVAHLWFSHSFKAGKSSTYIINNCPLNSKNVILSFAQQEADKTLALLRPLAIDAFIAEECLYEWAQDVFGPRKELIDYEKSSISLMSPTQIEHAVEELHSISHRLHIVRENLTDLQERLEYLSGIHQPLLEMLGNGHDQRGAESITESFKYLKAKTGTLKRWAINYTQRTGIRINLFFNVSSQSDNRTNLQIAKETSAIAVTTQQDSSSMITIAAVTMFFLPGTFVSAILGMVFSNSNSTDSVKKDLLLFFSITIPLTVAVFAVWLLWQRYRNKAHDLGITEMGNKLENGVKFALRPY